MNVDRDKVAEAVQNSVENARRMAEVISQIGMSVAEFGKAVQKLIDDMPKMEDFLQQSEKGDTLTHVSTDQKGGQE